MAAAGHARSIEEIAAAVAHAPDILRVLGSRRHDGSTLEDSVNRDPAVIGVWAACKRRALDATERRVYAKALLALIDAADHVGWDIVTTPATDSASSAAAAKPSAWTAPAPEQTRRRGVEIVRIAAAERPRRRRSRLR